MFHNKGSKQTGLKYIAVQSDRYDAELKNNQKQKFVLVPFADSGQTGAAVKVWLPLNEVLK